MTQAKEKWQSLVLSRNYFGWMFHGIQCFHFCFFFRANGEKEHFDENNSRHRYSNYLKSVILKVTWAQLCSNLKRHLKDTFQLKIFRTWINIGANLFLGTYHETKINEADSNGVWTHKHLFRKRTLNHLAKLAKESLDIQATIQCRFTLKRVRGMIITYSQRRCLKNYHVYNSPSLIF